MEICFHRRLSAVPLLRKLELESLGFAAAELAVADPGVNAPVTRRKENLE
jgi:hypothetical protein